MNRANVGTICKVNAKGVDILVSNSSILTNGLNDLGILNYFTIGSYLGTKNANGDIVVLRCEEIYDSDRIIVTCTYLGTINEILKTYDDGVKIFPLINQSVFTLDKSISSLIMVKGEEPVIGTYIYDDNQKITYDHNILFGKHLGVFGNTGSGKTCTIASIIQNHIRNYNSSIKFVILDVNGEYKNAFADEEMEYHNFENLNFPHHILSMPEYGKLFRASEGIQYPALKDSINDLKNRNINWSISELTDKIKSWITGKVGNDSFSSNQLNGYLRTMLLRIDSIMEDSRLMSIIENENSSNNTLYNIKKSRKKVHILDVNVSNDSLDIILFLLFKMIYLEKIIKHNFPEHLVLVLEEAHRYINNDSDTTKLGNYFIDKISREGRKFGLSLVISSQVPSMLSYSIISQCNSVVMHKITNKRDADYLKGILKLSSDIYYHQMNSLPKQHALVCGEAFKNDVVVRILDADPLPNSLDPTIDITSKNEVLIS